MRWRWNFSIQYLWILNAETFTNTLLDNLPRQPYARLSATPVCNASLQSRPTTPRAPILWPDFALRQNFIRSDDLTLWSTVVSLLHSFVCAVPNLILLIARWLDWNQSISLFCVASSRSTTILHDVILSLRSGHTFRSDFSYCLQFLLHLLLLGKCSLSWFISFQSHIICPVDTIIVHVTQFFTLGRHSSAQCIAAK